MSPSYPIPVVEVEPVPDATVAAALRMAADGDAWARAVARSRGEDEPTARPRRMRLTIQVPEGGWRSEWYADEPTALASLQTLAVHPTTYYLAAAGTGLTLRAWTDGRERSPVAVLFDEFEVRRWPISPVLACRLIAAFGSVAAVAAAPVEALAAVRGVGKVLAIRLAAALQEPTAPATPVELAALRAIVPLAPLWPGATLEMWLVRVRETLARPRGEVALTVIDRAIQAAREAYEREPAC